MPRTRQTVATLNRDIGRLEGLPQAVVAYGRELAKGETLPFHHHRRAQLVYASSGVMTVTTRSAGFVVPPQRAVWMPGGVDHRIDARSAVAMRTLYVELGAAAHLPAEVCVLQVTPLLRELILTAVATGPTYEPGSPQSRIMSVILDQIGTQPIASLALPMPTDPRSLRVAQALIANPADSRDLEEWAKVAGASKRTLGRLFIAQTQMSFQAWRQQRRLLRALELLASGVNVTTIALELGYDNTSAFIAMFRRCLGATPARYLSTTNQ
jgi:AraC-like DNA-binding protein/mannose-6-phosphate isomerase-like protein (cupin superfamily)